MKHKKTNVHIGKKKTTSYLVVGLGRWELLVGDGEVLLWTWSHQRHCDWWSWSSCHGHPKQNKKEDGQINTALNQKLLIQA